MKKRLLSLMLAACMMFSSMSMGVSADGGNTGDLTDTGVEIVESNWLYRQGTNDIHLTGYDGILSGSVVLPTEINGQTVKGFDYETFKGQIFLSRVIIPEGYESVPLWAFEGCGNLEEIHIPVSTEFLSVAPYLAGECPNLDFILYAGSEAQWNRLLDYDDDIRKLRDITVVFEKEMTYTWLYDGYYDTLTCFDGIIDGELTVPAEIDGHEGYGLGWWALKNQRGLTKLTIEDGVKYMDGTALEGCINLEEITIPYTFEDFWYYLDDCEKLHTINFTDSEERWNEICKNPEEIPEHITINFDYTDDSEGYRWIMGDPANGYWGFLVGVEGTLPAEVTVPAEIDGVWVHSIDYGAFQGQNKMRVVTFEEGITALYDVFWDGGELLKVVNLPSTIETLWHNFDYHDSQLPNLKTINFAGTQAQWDAINKKEDFIPSESVTLNILGGSGKPPHTHSYTYNVTKAATCTEEGSVTYTCSCGDQYTEVITKLMHSEYVVSGKEPTATSPGLTEGKVCAVCGEITQPQQEIPPIGAVAHGTHGNLTWVLYEDGELVISGKGDMAVDPDYLYPWLEIGYVSQIKKLTIAEGITSIAREAFDFCRALEEVTLPGSLTFIDTFAFENCDRLTDVYYGGSAAEWRKVQIEWYNTPLTSAQLYIGGKAVVDQGTHGDNLTWVLTDDGELIISGEGAMKENGLIAFPWRVSHENDITKVTIGDDITSIAESAFSGCKNVESVEIPESVTSIGMSAFMNCVNLKSIEIPETVTYIGNASFYNCRSLESINIPKAVSEIPYNTFCYCSALKDVYYSGSKAEWSAVVIDVRDSGNDPLLNATMHFAVEEEITVGNINGDAEINSSDVNLLYRSVMDYEELAAEQQAAADVNSDGKFNSADVNLLYRYVMGYAELQ